MAVAAFKSSLRRTNPPSSTSTSTSTTRTRTSSDKETKDKSVPPRRSRSVSAFSRTQNDVTSDFLIKRDNPLFWTNNSPPDEEITTSKTKSDDDNRRGRSVARNADAVAGKVDTARGRRGRSVSRAPVSRGHFVNSENEMEQVGSSSTKCRNKASSDVKKGSLVRTSSSPDMLKTVRTRPSLSCQGTPNSEEGEEKTIKAVSEQMKSFQGDDTTTTSGIYETVRAEVRRAISDIQNDLETTIRRSNAATIVTTNVIDIPPDLVNPGAVELVLDIRREYAKKLEESQERASKLRADLAVEEHRGLELSRILKEILPEPKTSNVQKSRPGRKNSIERRKMSKRLTEEAMAYFDECVSLSTFDSSDFSSQEDPPLNLVGFTTPVRDTVSLPQASPSVPDTNCPSSCLNDKQDGWFTHNHDALELSASISSKEPNLDPVSLNGTDRERGQKYQFSFAKPSETFEFQQDIMKYVRNFEKDTEKVDIDSQILGTNNYHLDEYTLQASPQSLLFDRVFFRNRLESGSLLLCSGGIAISSSPFVL